MLLFSILLPRGYGGGVVPLVLSYFFIFYKNKIVNNRLNKGEYARKNGYRNKKNIRRDSI
jgi:hypothetical protein